MIVNARVLGDPLASGMAVEKAIDELNPALVVFDVADLETRWQIASFQQRIAGTFVGAFGLVALILATVGVYGVTAYTTRQRVHEIGIRTALGASKENVLRLVLGQGLRLMLIGVTLGLLAASGLTRYLKSMLLGVTSADALTFFTVAFLLCGVARLACCIPALRAIRTDPMVALRHE
jgi:ABC-type antimicrobial peptide transport system permease subunit